VTLLDVRDLEAGYGDLQVLHGVDLAVGDGEYVAIVGPNGAGKSTAMKTIVGLTTFMSGTVEFEGEDIAGLAPQKIIQRGVGYVPQSGNVFPSLTVEENLRLGGYLEGGADDDDLDRVYEQFPVLEERTNQRAGNLSGGQQQMLAMGRALVLDPPLVLLDEPSAGLAPDLVTTMFDHIDTINEAGTAVLIVEQNAKTALERCERGYVLAQGENRHTDTGEALLGDEQVRRDFLGG
jgi:branched-chain amino acid transport system ATP-binding protein